jgi:hypothetical protein
MTERYLSAHARRRIRQRGTPLRVLDALKSWADSVVPVGDGCVSLGLSRAAEEEAIAEGVPADLVRKARARRVVVAADGTVPTVLVCAGGHGRAYRRRHDGRRRRRLPRLTGARR